jgi:hypothetical protein
MVIYLVFSEPNVGIEPTTLGITSAITGMMAGVAQYLIVLLTGTFQAADMSICAVQFCLFVTNP